MSQPENNSSSDRRQFLKQSAAGVAAAGCIAAPALANETSLKKDAESFVKVLYESLKPEQ